MAGALNRWPVGLLGFLDLKVGGRYPQSLGDVVVPQLELWQQYVNQQLFSTQLTAPTDPLIASDSGGATYGFTAGSPLALPVSGGQVAVPQDEIWYVRQFSIHWTWNSIAAGVVDFSPMYQVPNSGSRFPSCTRQGQTDSQAAVGVSGRSMITDPIWLLPGYAPRFVVNRQTVPGGGSVAISGQIELARIRI